MNRREMEEQAKKEVRAMREDDFRIAEEERTREVRIVNDKTGGEKGSKAERYELLPYDQLGKVARHYGKGAEKYADNNWRKGYAWSLSYGAMQRHLAAFWSGEDIDEETGSTHLAAAVFHCLALMLFMDEFPELDDRPSTAMRRTEEEKDVPYA